MKYLAERLTAFLKDYDYFDYMDSMEIGETDADMVEKNKAMLNSPMMLRHSIIIIIIKSIIITYHDVCFWIFFYFPHHS